MPQVYFDDEGPGEHDAHLLDDASHSGNDLVPCPECGKMILAMADRCHRCGAVFQDEAWMVSRTGKQGLWLLVAFVVLIAFTAIVLGLL